MFAGMHKNTTPDIRYLRFKYSELDLLDEPELDSIAEPGSGLDLIASELDLIDEPGSELDPVNGLGSELDMLGEPKSS